MFEKFYHTTVNYLYINLSKNNQLNESEKAKLKYSLEVIIGELIKMMIVLFMFSFLGLVERCLYSLITLSLIRPYIGGIHFNTYTQCLAFSISFIGISIFLSTHFLINMDIGILLLMVDTVIICMIAPIVSPKRPKYNIEKIKRFKLFSTILILLHLILFLILKNNPYIQNSIWIITLMIIQLIISWRLQKNDKRNFT